MLDFVCLSDNFLPLFCGQRCILKQKGLSIAQHRIHTIHSHIRCSQNSQFKVIFNVAHFDSVYSSSGFVYSINVEKKYLQNEKKRTENVAAATPTIILLLFFMQIFHLWLDFMIFFYLSFWMLEEKEEEWFCSRQCSKVFEHSVCVYSAYLRLHKI